jgi:hypothetical protein
MIALAKNEVIFEAKEAISFLTHKKTALPKALRSRPHYFLDVLESGRLQKDRLK